MEDEDFSKLEAGHSFFQSSEEKQAQQERLRQKVNDQYDQLDRLAGKHLEHYRQHGQTELQAFQTLVGVHFVKYGGGAYIDRQKPPASVWHDIFRPDKTATARFRNRGLYDRTLSQTLKNRVVYSLSDYLISGLYLLQILVAATLTALSSKPRQSPTTLTVLGAIDTVIAGILAWLTGQGMPVANYPQAQNGPEGEKDKKKAAEMERRTAKHKEQKKEMKKAMGELQARLEDAEKTIIRHGMEVEFRRRDTDGKRGKNGEIERERNFWEAARASDQSTAIGGAKDSRASDE